MRVTVLYVACVLAACAEPPASGPQSPTSSPAVPERPDVGARLLVAAGASMTAPLRVRFAEGSSAIAPEAEPALQQIAAALASVGPAYVVGHADPSSSNALELSRLRASAVVAWLGAHGVDAAALTAVAAGAAEPLADPTSKSGRAQNERVEIKVRR